MTPVQELPNKAYQPWVHGSLLVGIVWQQTKTALEQPQSAEMAYKGMGCLLWRVSRSVSAILKYTQKWNDIIYRYSRLWIDVTTVEEPDIHVFLDRKKDLGRAFLYTLHLFLNTVHRLGDELDSHINSLICTTPNFQGCGIRGISHNKLQVIGVNEISRRRSTNTQMDRLSNFHWSR